MEAVCPQKLPNLNDPSGYNKGRYDQIKRLLPYLKKESEDCLYLNLYVTSYGKFELWIMNYDAKEGFLLNLDVMCSRWALFKSFDRQSIFIKKTTMSCFDTKMKPRAIYFHICFDESTRTLRTFHCCRNFESSSLFFRSFFWLLPEHALRSFRLFLCFLLFSVFFFCCCWCCCCVCYLKIKVHA